MAVRTSFTAGEVLAAADLTDTFGAKLNLAGGKVLQVVRTTITTDRTTTSSSFVDVTGMSVTITPQKSDSAIILIGSFLAGITGTGAGEQQQSNYRITDNSNNSISGGELAAIGPINGYAVASSIWRSPVVMFAYSMPATTSATIYKMRFARGGLNVTAEILNSAQTGQMYAIEVSA